MPSWEVLIWEAKQAGKDKNRPPKRVTTVVNAEGCIITRGFAIPKQSSSASDASSWFSPYMTPSDHEIAAPPGLVAAPGYARPTARNFEAKSVELSDLYDEVRAYKLENQPRRSAGPMPESHDTLDAQISFDSTWDTYWPCLSTVHPGGISSSAHKLLRYGCQDNTQQIKPAELADVSIVTPELSLSRCTTTSSTDHDLIPPTSGIRSLILAKQNRATERHVVIASPEDAEDAILSDYGLDA